MRRVFFFAVCGVLCSAPAYSIQSGLDIGAGATFELGDNIMSEESDSLAGPLAAVLNTLTSLRIGGFVDGYVDLVGPLSLGSEFGVYGFVGTDEDGNATLSPLVDLVARGFFRGTLGIFLLQAHIGYNFATYVDLEASNGLAIAHKLDMGARVALGGLYVEYDYLIWGDNLSSFRVAAGLLLRDPFSGGEE